ncbi:protein kinase [Sorangium cellulosum]|uniref:Protein kinase n=1 Tax=Sorangium cellulosum TaxID=56 RepID=A0A2L0F0L9_SORCE|nr:serine/threonine-protein kinase [Sorangium cellulosum]AUX45091.1 protein kinase [Sorangium cellulosum]
MNKRPEEDESPSRAAPAEAPAADELEAGSAPTWDQRTFDTRDRDGDHHSIPASAALRAGEYLLDGVIAEGGFGVVYRAVHATKGTPAAVKIMHAELITRADVVMRFQREVDAIGRIRHPNVVEILDVGRVEDGRPYFAMELLQGRSLEQHLFSRGRLPADEALAILDPLCSALAAVHAVGIVHRDVKPSNVILCEQGAGIRVVLLDFGIAKLLDTTELSLTSSRHVVGTPAFMSPEQLLNRPVDMRTDVYALGALLYTMVAGSMPFSASAYPVLRHLHLHQAPPRPSLHAPVDPAFDDIVVRAMSKDPAGRHPDVTTFLEEVQAATARVARTEQKEAGRIRRLAIGLLVEVLAELRALEAPTDSFLTDFESVLPQVMTELSAAGFSALAVTSTSVLLAADWPRDEREAAEARRRAVSAALSLVERLDRSSGHDRRVGVRFCLHAGEVVVTEDGSAVGGNVLELSSCLPETAEQGVYASPAMLEGLGFTSHRTAAAPGASIPMRRVVARPPAGPAEPA